MHTPVPQELQPTWHCHDGSAYSYHIKTFCTCTSGRSQHCLRSLLPLEPALVGCQFPQSACQLPVIGAGC